MKNIAEIKLNKELNILKDSIQISPKWYIFPFEINAGAISNTETGYKPLKSKVTDYGSYELIFTGDSPVIVIWKGSTKIYQKNKGVTNFDSTKVNNQDQFYTKQYNLETAKKWEAHLIEDISSVNFNSLNSNTLFNTLQIGRTYKLISFSEQIKVNDYLQFFVCLNDNDTNLANDGTVQDRQLLYLSNVTNKYYPYPSNKFFCQIITLSSVNDRASANGLTVQSFIQYGAPGSGYAFPQFKDKKLQFNRELMKNIGVRFVHRQFYGLEALSSISYFGRPIIQGETPIQVEKEKEIFEQKVYASRRLFIAGSNEHSTTDIKNNGGVYPGLNDPIQTNSHPETTFYNIMDARPTGFLNYKDWQEFLASKQFNILAEKSFKGIIAFDDEKAKKSNETSIDSAKFFWDSEWNINNLAGTYNVEMSSNFRYKNPETQSIIGTAAIDYSKISQKWMSAILNFNSVVFSPLIQMPYDANQWLPFSFSTLPLIGKMLNDLGLGIPVGWVITQNSQQYKKMSYFNVFMSAFYVSAMDNIFGKPGLIPLNLFSNQNEFEIGKMLGAKVSTNAMLMKLSDRVSVFPWDPNTGQRLKTKEQISTVDLSQRRNNKVYILDEESEFLDIKSPLTTKDKKLQWNPTEDGIFLGGNYAYIIDYLVTQSLAQGEEKHIFYSDNPFTYQSDYNEISVAQYKIKNQASFTDNLFNWTTQYKLNHDEYSETEETTFSYPAKILPPDPINVAKPIEIETKNLIINKSEVNNELVNITSNSVSDSTQDWIDKNKNNNSVSQIVNIKELLDSSLFINSFNDLKRFYKSISINYSYKFTTNENISNEVIRLPGDLTINTNFKTSESFSNKELNSTIEISLNDLIFKEYNKIASKKYFNKINTPAYKNHCGYAGAWFESSSQYKLNNFNFNLNQNNEVGFLKIDYNLINNNSISFNIQDNNDLIWKFTLDVVLVKIEGKIYNTSNKQYAYGKRYSSNINARISKVILNPR